MKDSQTEEKPATVSGSSRQAGEIRARWSWVEPSVWTERMLTALDKGVKGGKWFSVIDKVYSKCNLEAAYRRVKRNRGSAGVDHQTIAMFEDCLEQNLERISEWLRNGSYTPQAVRRVWIPKPGKQKQSRPLGIPTVRDRVVQTAMRNVLEPIFEVRFADTSYGFRPGRGCKDALRRVDHLLKQGFTWVVDADLKSYFDTIPHERLMQRIEDKVSDTQMLELIRQFLVQEVMESMRSWKPEGGTPQGAVISPLLSNIYLDPLDHLMMQGDFAMTRYADDFVIQCRTRAEAEHALEVLQGWVENAGLTLHPEKTRLVDASQPGGFDFLGYHFERGYRWPSEKSKQKMKNAILGKTKRTNGKSLRDTIDDVNRTTKGWFEYFKHSNKTAFPPIDGWIRMRLRSILRRRRRGHGRGRGADHQRWPNTFFVEQGLFSLVAAHATACQSSRR